MKRSTSGPTAKPRPTAKPKPRPRPQPSDRSPPKFEPGQIVKTPATVCEAETAQIFGREWGPDNRFLHGGSWVYSLWFFIKDPRPGIDHNWRTNETFLATEEELVAWQE